MSSEWLVVAAFAPELTEVPTEVARAAVGVGMVAAALGAARAIADHAARGVVLVGTCGAYPGSGRAIGDVVVARRVKLVDPAAAMGKTALPPLVATELALDDVHSARFAGVRADVATTLGVTTDDALAAAIARASACDVEHMEAFAVAQACADARVPFACVLGVANVVGSGARDEWRANHARVSATVAACLARGLAAAT